jgi:hypothetical protein
MTRIQVDRGDSRIGCSFVSVSTRNYHIFDGGKVTVTFVVRDGLVSQANHSRQYNESTTQVSYQVGPAELIFFAQAIHQLGTEEAAPLDERETYRNTEIKKKKASRGNMEAQPLRFIKLFVKIDNLSKRNNILVQNRRRCPYAFYTNEIVTISVCFSTRQVRSFREFHESFNSHFCDNLS